jgi:hypothetical protein
MKIYTRICFPVVLLVMLLLSACSYSRVVTSWRDDSLQSGQLKKTMVLVIVKKDVIRNRLEDEFVLQLQKLGVQAVQSYKTFPDLTGVDAQQIKASLVAAGLDSVLVARLVDTKNETSYVPATTGYSTTFGSYYGGTHAVVYSPGYSYDYLVFTLQNNLFAARDEKLVWSAVTETEEPQGSVDDALRDFAEVIIKDMKNNKVY